MPGQEGRSGHGLHAQPDTVVVWELLLLLPSLARLRQVHHNQLYVQSFVEEQLGRVARLRVV